MSDWTDEDIQYLDSHYETTPNSELVKILGRSRSAILTQAYRRRLRKKRNIYAMYKGEDLLAVGTADEIAASWGVYRTTIWNYATPYKRKQAAANKELIYAVRVED